MAGAYYPGGNGSSVRFTVSQVIQVIVLLVGLFMAWADLKSDVRELKWRVGTLEKATYELRPDSPRPIPLGH